MKHFLSLLIIAFTTLLLSGCVNKADKAPADTILGANYSLRPDWVDDETVYTEQGLSLRTAESFRGADVNKYANHTPQTSLYFNFDRSSISAEERAKLTDAIAVLQNDPYAGLLIVGHCDWHGTQEYNLSLGDKRATSVESYLSSLGAESSRIRTLSKGSLQAKSHGSPSDSWADRRVDVIVMR